MQFTELKNGGFTARLINYGATLQSLCLDGVELVAGYPDLRSYKECDTYFGATVGRTCNRTGRVNYIDGKEYLLELNENGVNHLHGGFLGLSRREWELAGSTPSSATFRTVSPDGEDGYPGNLTVTAEYRLLPDGLFINHKAVCDKPCWVSLTNHSYFNLNGIGGGSVFGTSFAFYADEVSTYGENARVTGRQSVRSAFARDLRSGFVLESDFDHNFFVSSEKYLLGLKLIAEAEGKYARMSVATDLPCFQFYTGGFIKEGTLLDGGRIIGKSGAFCIETQFEPGSPERGEAVLRPGDLYDRSTFYKIERI